MAFAIAGGLQMVEIYNVFVKAIPGNFVNLFLSIDVYMSKECDKDLTAL